ncbi:cyclase family protein [Terrisporobacter sp.]
MKVIDLTHFIEEEMTVYCEEESANIKSLYKVEDCGFNVLTVELSTHTGTHIDSARHIFKDGPSIDDFDLNKFVGSAYILDCRDMQEITLDTILKHKDEIEKVDYLILKTGWEDKWYSDEYLEGYPILSNEACEFLSNMDNLTGIGLDAISVDSRGKDVQNHRTLLSKGKMLIENLCNLKDIEDKFNIIIAPLKVRNADGAPARVYAVVN